MRTPPTDAAARGGALAPTADHARRLAAVADMLAGAARVLDLGCGQGALTLLLARRGAAVVAVDEAREALEALSRALLSEPAAVRGRVTLLHAAIPSLDARLAGHDAAALVEVLEHVAPDRIDRIEAAVFGRLRPRRVALSTPNAEANAALGAPPGRLRHPDHRFEWPRARFADWARGVARRTGYAVALSGIGPDLPGCGAPTQVARFERIG